MKPAKKKPAKRKPPFEKRHPILSKLLDLKYRINDAYRNREDDDMNTIHDKSWVMSLINDIRHNSVKFTKLCKEDFEKCNGLWRTYE